MDESSSGLGLRNLMIGSNSVNGGFHEIFDNEKILTFGGSYLLCTGYI